MILSNELQAKAQWCTDLMRADKITAEHVATLTEEQKHDLAMSYMEAVGRKIQAIQGIYLTRTGAKECLHNVIATTI